jgi:hypothetical protein
MLGLDDLTGTADSSLQLGIMSAEPDPAAGTWPGGAPLDWRFLIDPTTVDSTTLLPTARFTTASIAARQLNAGPNDVTIVLSLGGTPAALQMRGARIIATIDSSPAPSRPAAPPTLLASGVTMFESVTATDTRGLCGNVTVESLSRIPLPEALAIGGDYECLDCTFGSRVSHSYTYCSTGEVTDSCNSLLDAIVGGCRYGACFIGLINATQPDVGGAGFSGTLTVDATTHKVPNSQTVGNTRAYSSFFTFTANRAHATGLQP